MLDDSLERSYRDLNRRNIRTRAHILRELREIRIDMARVSDELMNITKFFGDWHLARIYENLAARFQSGYGGRNAHYVTGTSISKRGIRVNTLRPSSVTPR